MYGGRPSGKYACRSAAYDPPQFCLQQQYHKANLFRPAAMGDGLGLYTLFYGNSMFKISVERKPPNIAFTFQKEISRRY